MRRRHLLAVVALVGAFVGGGCGADDVDTVATVDDAQISQAEFDERLAGFRRGVRTVHGAEARRQRRFLEQQALHTLLVAEWVEREAEAQGVDVSKAEVAARYNHLARTGGDGERSAVLAGSRRETSNDRRSVVRVDLLRAKLARRAADKTVAPGEVARYYREHKERFGSLPRRDLYLLKAPSRPTALGALNQLADGWPWERVQRGFPKTDQAPVGVRAAVPGELPSPVEQAVFKAPLRVPRGPVRAGSGWYAFEVVRRFKPTSISLTEATPEITTALSARAIGEQLELLDEKLRRRYASETTCEGSVQTDDCGAES